MLYALSEIDVELKYDSLLSNCSVTQVKSKLLEVLIHQKQGLKYDVKDVLDLSRLTVLGDRYWGDDKPVWYDNSVYLTTLAYKILQNHDEYDQEKQFEYLSTSIESKLYFNSERINL